MIGNRLSRGTVKERRKEKKRGRDEMAATTSATFPRMLKALRENDNVKEKREALTYIAR